MTAWRLSTVPDCKHTKQRGHWLRPICSLSMTLRPSTESWEKTSTAGWRQETGKWFKWHIVPRRRYSTLTLQRVMEVRGESDISYFHQRTETVTSNCFWDKSHFQARLHYYTLVKNDRDHVSVCSRCLYTNVEKNDLFSSQTGHVTEIEKSKRKKERKKKARHTDRQTDRQKQHRTGQPRGNGNQTGITFSFGKLSQFTLP